MLFVLLVLIGIAALTLLYGKLDWDSGTRALRARLESNRVSIESSAHAAAELANLPAPVQRYFRAALTDGRSIVTAATVEHTGRFNMGDSGEHWKRFSSTQRVTTNRPGFDWDARIAIMPGLAVHVHDAYIAGKGLLQAAALGFIPVAHVEGGGELARGELMRYFAEAAWYPTALVPGQGVRWEPVDDRSARATLTDGAIAVTLLFTFNDEGLIDTIHADARGRTVGKRVVPTPWQGRFWNYATRDGMRIPLAGEVAWLLPDGPRPYWRGHIESIAYEFAR